MVVPEALMYSCRFWAVHLCEAGEQLDIETLTQLDSFLDSYLLSWLEVLGNAQLVDVALQLLIMVSINLKTVYEDFTRARLVDDACRFVSTFRNPISCNTAQIYLSALPFADEESNIFLKYKSAFPNIVASNTLSNGDVLPRDELSFTPTLAQDLATPLDRQAVTKFARIPQHNLSPSVLCISLSPNGNQLALGMNDASLHVWDMQTGVPMFVLAGHAEPIRSVAFGEHCIVSGDAHGSVCLWASSTGEYLYEPVHLSHGRDSRISCIALSPDGSQFAFCAEDNTFGIFDMANSRTITQSTIRSDYWIRTLIWTSITLGSGDSAEYIIGGGDECIVRTWDALSGALQDTSYDGHESYICALAYSPENNIIASGGDDRTIVLRDMSAGGVAFPLREFTLHGHTSTVRCLVFVPSGRYLLSGSDDGIVIVWRINYNLLSAHPVGSPIQADSRKINGLAVLPDGRVLINGLDQAVKIWNMECLFNEAINNYVQPGPLKAVLPLPDGKTLISSDGHRI